MNRDCFVLLDDITHGHARLFQHWQACDRLAAADLDALDACLQHGWRQGWHAVLWLPYDFGRPLHGLDDTPAHSGHMSVHWFAVQRRLDAAQTEHWLTQQDDGSPNGIARCHSDTGRPDYLDDIATIHAAIARGDTYQINHTVRLGFDTYGPPAGLYRRLRARQPVPYAALACLPDDAAWTLCLSPELFLHLHADGRIETRPMKGTAPICHDGHDEERANALRQDPKNRAENVMIVDLLRNDLGRIARTGGVRVPSAFDVAAFGKVWQMTSTVEADIRPGTPLADIIRATFPCGSITGAPKRMSMHIIDTLEHSPRHLYTGSLGHIAPCHSGPGFSGSLNVAIRTLQITPTAHGGRGVMGVGSGIVTDSVAADEYTECQWKSAFVTALPPTVALIESLAVHDGACPLLPLHQARLSRAAADLQFPADAENIAQALHQAVLEAAASGSRRVRICLHPDGSLTHEQQPLTALTAPQRVLIDPARRIRPGLLAQYKTDHRAVYDQAWQDAAVHDCFDALLFDENGILLEGGRSNVFVQLADGWHTPGTDLPILPGVMRQAVLAEPQRYLGSDNVQFSHLTITDLRPARRWLLCNAVRGVMEVEAVWM
ncbi:para-aminobenzoate synthetase/4-amino-4-deoxychorismate lyase [Neisseria sp. HSC-16F19]|nr:bifunctional chorismate-binding protein/class IV aminotransferase [Neisseria sp. HSC-16F19]MCP2040866.1 para-aminobenzoate synthetase/4-amino-4-deoxychorismate lyase [Neisseria sp. HSC-16F19]